MDTTAGATSAPIVDAPAEAEPNATPQTEQASGSAEPASGSGSRRQRQVVGEEVIFINSIPYTVTKFDDGSQEVSSW